MNNKDFQNGLIIGYASGGVVEVEIPAKEEQEKTITITENGTTEILPDTDKALSKVTVVTDIKSGGGLDRTVTFTADGVPCEITSLKAGNSVNAPATVPTSENGTFEEWQDTEGNRISFPFTPEAEETELVALFLTVRDSISVTNKDTLIATGVRNSEYRGQVIKSYDGLAVCGYTKNTDGISGYYYLVSETKDGCKATNLVYVGTAEYNGKIYHYSKNSILANINYNGASTMNCQFIGNQGDFQSDMDAVAALLDYYYLKR